MSKIYITIDGGTTNTRVYLWRGDTLLGVKKQETGVRNTAIDGNNQRLKQAIKDGMDTLLTEYALPFDAVDAVIASGMLTSNLGIMEIPHLEAPVGIQELAKGIRQAELPEICPGRICFIPGVKNAAASVSADHCEAMDMMRGEETETIAVLQDCPQPILLVLPGSHTKVVAIDELGRIAACLTTITGELLSAITNHTILADSVGRQFVGRDDYNVDMVLRGFRGAQRVGVGRTCFSGRILGQFSSASRTDVANYILGAVLEEDVRAMKSSQAIQMVKAGHVAVAGGDPMRRALVDVLREDGSFGEIISLAPPVSGSYAATGARLIAECAGLI